VKSVSFGIEIEKEKPESLLEQMGSAEPLEDSVLLVELVWVDEERVLLITDVLGTKKGVGDMGRVG
jgi:hypothetical protein